VNPATGLNRLMDALIRSAHTDEAVAIALRVSVGMVRKRRLALGLPAQSQRKRGGLAITAERTERANDMRYDGAKPEAIAKALGVSRRTVYRMLRPELKTGDKTYSAATRQRLSIHMRDKVQPLGAASERTWHENRAKVMWYRKQVWLEKHGRGR